MELGGDSMQLSGHTLDTTEESALVQIRWKESKRDQKYKEITVRGPVKLKCSTEDPTDFHLKVKPDDGGGSLDVPLPSGVDWKVTSKKYEMEDVTAQVLRMSFDSPEKRKVKLRIGLPLTNKVLEEQAKKFSQALIMANAHSGMKRAEPREQQPAPQSWFWESSWSMFPKNHNSKSRPRPRNSGSRIHANPFLRRNTQFQRARNPFI